MQDEITSNLEIQQTLGTLLPGCILRAAWFSSISIPERNYHFYKNILSCKIPFAFLFLNLDDFLVKFIAYPRSQPIKKPARRPAFHSRRDELPFEAGKPTSEGWLMPRYRMAARAGIQ